MVEGSFDGTVDMLDKLDLRAAGGVGWVGAPMIPNYDSPDKLNKLFSTICISTCEICETSGAGCGFSENGYQDTGELEGEVKIRFCLLVTLASGTCRS